MRNEITTWQQGRFAPEGRHNISAEDAALHDQDERHLVRPGLRENAICRCPRPEDAAWIAQRLNRAALLEQMIMRLVRQMDTRRDDLFELLHDTLTPEEARTLSSLEAGYDDT